VTLVKLDFLCTHIPRDGLFKTERLDALRQFRIIRSLRVSCPTFCRLKSEVASSQRHFLNLRHAARVVWITGCVSAGDN